MHSDFITFFMQLSDDGNFMWNGTEWIPNPDAAVATPEHKLGGEVETPLEPLQSTWLQHFQCSNTVF